MPFSAGDIIEIIDETNADWWRGRFNGKEGLFPSNYVEKLNARAPSPPPSAVRPPSFAPPAFPPAGAQYSSYSTPVASSAQSSWGRSPSPVPPIYQSPPVKQDYYVSQPAGPVVYQSPNSAPPPPAAPKPSKFSGLGGTVRFFFLTFHAVITF